MPLNISRIQAICLDIDGTLRDTDDQYVARVAQLLRPLRRLLPQREPHLAARWLVMRFEGPVNSLFALADRLGLDAALHRILDLSNPWRSSRGAPAYVLIPKIRPAIEILSKHFPLAIVTARGTSGTQTFLKDTQLEEYFSSVVTALTTKHGKPSADPVLWAAQKMNTKPQNCLMVGDTIVDIIAGKAAGAQTVGLLSGFGDEAELRAYGADLILKSLADLPDALSLVKRDSLLI
ncbi:MAG: HAD family hydrolase [Chloroflexi bacterium]|nr:HAD family hydrolase [Chloroflexota bacterium]